MSISAVSMMFVNLGPVSENLPLIMTVENLIIATCYTIIGSGISYGIWRNRAVGINPVIVTVASIFYSCALGHGMHGLGMLGINNALFWQTATDLITVIVAIRFLTYYESFDVLARIGQILAEKAELTSQNILLQDTLTELKQTQTRLIQAEKMSSLGQLVAGIAHEINNPVNFIYGNLPHVQSHADDLLYFIGLYQKHYSDPVPAIQAESENIDLEFLREDFAKILTSIRIGTERIRQIVLSLRSFSRMDEAEWKEVDIHEGIDSTLMILQHRLKAQPGLLAVEVIRDYANLPLVKCYPGQLNQVIMNILANAIDALEERRTKPSLQEPDYIPAQITIQTAMTENEWVKIMIADNGSGIPEKVQEQIFNPFFTTKPIGKGTGMGLSISYQIIVEEHGGKLDCFSKPNQGTEFVIQIPAQQEGAEIDCAISEKNFPAL